jgi:transcriptional regulator with XRE-family HTH domain
MITAEKFNQELGTIMRHERKQQGRSMQTIADIIGISCHQVQKYETGVNALSAYRLLQVASALEISAEDFINRAMKATKKRSVRLK